VMPEGQPADESISVQEVWEAAGGNPGIKATKSELLDALRMLDEVCDEAGRPAAPGAPSDFAGVLAWIGDKQCKVLITQSEITHEREPGFELSRAASNCCAKLMGSTPADHFPDAGNMVAAPVAAVPVAALSDEQINHVFNEHACRQDEDGCDYLKLYRPGFRGVVREVLALASPTPPVQPDADVQRDAARYRWLLDNYARGDGYDLIDAALNDGEPETQLSPAIDAAMALAAAQAEGGS